MTAPSPASSTGRKAVRLVISGKVQGVFYRAWAVETATGLGLDGWVRNDPDGTVEAVAAGPAGAVDRFVAACRQGPSAARVANIDVSPAEEPGESGFRQV